MSSGAPDFKNIKTREVIIFFSMQGAEVKSRHSERNIRLTCTILRYRQKLGAQYKRGDFSSCVEPRPGRPKTVTTPDINVDIHQLILDEVQILVNQYLST
jgi:radical SAM superfamily enzyme with C-terminal helix-hairpin-helix motif